MARFLAVSDVPGITEERFRGTFDAIRKWRFDKRAWITKAYCDVNRGKLFIECEAPDQAKFEDWLRNAKWKVSSIHEVDLIFEAGAIWPMRRQEASA
jgi:hypothetical protein